MPTQSVARRRPVPSSFTAVGVLTALTLLGSSSLFAQSPPGVAAVSPEMLEADWIRQNELRGWAMGLQTGATRLEDAAGGCDGVKNGLWGFHTENETNPWWQVDLTVETAIAEVRIFNRCDAFPERTASIIVLFSDDGSQWHEVYRHDGSVFFGQRDGKPLSVQTGGKSTRFIRLQLAGQTYFHLDEVEIYRPGSDENIALAKPARQSSQSMWSTSKLARPSDGSKFATRTLINRGLRLADDLQRLGTDTFPAVRALRLIESRLGPGSPTLPLDEQRTLYLEANRIVRRMALSNPLLDFDSVLFVKRAPGMFPHMSDQHYGWWSRPGGGIYILEGFRSDKGRIRCLTPDWSSGSFTLPELSYDARRILFAWCKHYPETATAEKSGKTNLPEDGFYHIYEMNLDGTGVRQLTFGRYDDFNACYLPSGEIVFLSTRKGRTLQMTKADTLATCEQTAPDSYVRCGGDDVRPCPVFTLHAMSADGRDLRPLSAFENFEWYPTVAPDGRIFYARWDYIDRFNGPYMSLWSTLPDGGNAQLVYGNYTKNPHCIFEARPIPGSRKLVFTAAPHHSFTGGALALLDRSKGSEGAAALAALTPEVPYPEVEGWAPMYYTNPWPLSENHFLVTWSDRKLVQQGSNRPPTDEQHPPNTCGIYLYDAFGNLTLLHRDPAISSMHPIPLRPRPKPAQLANHVDWDGKTSGRFLVQDVYQGLPGIPRGTVKRLRVVGMAPKVQPHMNTPSIGMTQEEPAKYVLGSAPVQTDGSALLEVPAGVPVMFQALDKHGFAVQTMRSLTYIQPGQVLSCIGCHESREAAPRVGPIPMALAQRDHSLTPGPEGSWPLQYERLVQPVLDRNCGSCHTPGDEGEPEAGLDLSADKSYASLMTYGDNDLAKRSGERDASLPGDCVAAGSRLMRMLTSAEGHHGVELEAAELERLATWMDLYAPKRGAYSDEQEAELHKLRGAWYSSVDARRTGSEAGTRHH